MSENKNKSGCYLIVAERERQQNEEGYTAGHDDDHDDGELALAAICYAAPTKIFMREDYANAVTYQDPWPWSDSEDKRYDVGHDGGNVLPDPEKYTADQQIDFLIKAGALIAAEIDRLQRIRIRG